ncbi:type II toxin-antitoxin system RelB/DinJ family antitoxin [Enterococcus faecium]|nr:type II toxin-antitoxin system RelB/DinJ family antitoxin [Enterococcus faecium]HAQ1518020.1 hypothetical protein [Enterococcus faecium]
MKKPIPIRINKNMKDDAKKLFADLGTNTTKEITRFLELVVVNESLPFEPITKGLPQYVGKDTLLQIEVEEKLKKESNERLKALGMTLSTAINLFIRQCLIENNLPYKINNAD